VVMDGKAKAIVVAMAVVWEKRILVVNGMKEGVLDR
jgi:hypothetical protein